MPHGAYTRVHFCFVSSAYGLGVTHATAPPVGGGGGGGGGGAPARAGPRPGACRPPLCHSSSQAHKTSTQSHTKQSLTKPGGAPPRSSRARWGDPERPAARPGVPRFCRRTSAVLRLGLRPVRPRALPAARLWGSQAVRGGRLSREVATVGPLAPVTGAPSQTGRLRREPSGVQTLDRSTSHVHMSLIRLGCVSHKHTRNG